MDNESKGLVFGGIGVISFALTLPATRQLVAYMDPLFIGLGRALLAGLVAAILLLITQQAWPSRSQTIRLCLVSLGVVIGFPVSSAFAMQTLPASHGGVVLAILPLATAAVSRLISNERPSSMFWLLSFLGASLIVFYTIGEAGILLAVESADALLLLAVISAAVGYAVGGKLATEMGGWQVICWALVIALPVLIYPVLFLIPFTPNQSSFLLSHSGWSALQSMPKQALINFAYLSLISQLLGFFFWYRGLALGGVARVSQLQLLQPFITIGVSAWLLAEVIPLSTWWYAIAVVTVVALSKRTQILTAGRNH